jgi:lactate dehydrogenase-like 2-hydroxyacid dehydrogenase
VAAKPEILTLAPLYPPALAELERAFVVHKLWTAKDPDAFVQEVCGRVRGMVTTGLAGFKRRQIDALPKLEIIGCFGTAHGTLELSAAKERGITVTNTPDWTEDAVADIAVGLIIAVMRRICEADRFIRAGKWPAGPFPMASDLRGKICGIVGFGRIGRAIAKRVEPFGMSVMYNGPKRKPDTAYPYVANLESLARESDCLIITCPLTAATRNLVDGRILAALGAEGVLVNVARGGLVDERALIAALDAGQIAGAGLEVFWDEPQVPAALLAMEQVVLVPHIGSSTREIREWRTAKLLLNLRAHFAGQPVPDPVR